MKAGAACYEGGQVHTLQRTIKGSPATYRSGRLGPAFDTNASSTILAVLDGIYPITSFVHPMVDIQLQPWVFSPLHLDGLNGFPCLSKGKTVKGWLTPFVDVMEAWFTRMGPCHEKWESQRILELILLGCMDLPFDRTLSTGLLSFYLSGILASMSSFSATVCGPSLLRISLSLLGCHLLIDGSICLVKTRAHLMSPTSKISFSKMLWANRLLTVVILGFWSDMPKEWSNHPCRRGAFYKFCPQSTTHGAIC